MKQCVKGACAAVILFFGVSHSVYGIPTLRLYDVGTGATKVIVDESAGPPADFNIGTKGSVVFIGAVGNFTINITTGLTKPAAGDPINVVMDVSSQNTSSQADTLIIEFSDISYGPSAANLVFSASITGNLIDTSGSSTYKTFLDPTDTLFAGAAVPGAEPGADLLTSLASGPIPAKGGYSGSTTATVGPQPSYSLTQLITLVHNAKGSSSLDDSLTGSPVPEPASLLLLGSGLAGLAYLRLFRRS